MPPATCSRMCSRDSDWTGKCESAWSSVWFETVIVSASYLFWYKKILLISFSVICRTQSWPIINIYGSDVFGICSFFLCIESNALEKSTNFSVASRFFCPNSFDDSTEYQNLRCCGSISESRSDFSNEFFRLRVGYDWEAGHYKP